MKKDSNRELILSAAKKLFGHFGYMKTTMTDIANETGKKKSSIYYYFSSKDELYRAVVDDEILHMREYINQKISEKTDPKDQLKAFILARFHAISQITEVYNILRKDYFGQKPYFEQIRNRNHVQEIAVVKGILERGINLDIFQISDTRFAAVGIVTSLRGLEIPLFTDDDHDLHMEKRIDAIMNVILHGIIK
jgi:AcrR family transcriptional regulator